VFILEATDGWAKICHVRGVGEGGGRLEVGEYASAGLVGFFRIALYVMVGGVGAEYADEVGVLVAMRRRLIIVLAQFVADAVYGGVSEAVVGGVVVPELGCTAVTPRGTFGVAREWCGYIRARNDGVLGGKDRLELVAVMWGRLRPVVSCGRVLVVLFEDGLEGGSCRSGEVVAGCWDGGVSTLLGLRCWVLKGLMVE
jgi:hypothetical protein